MPQHVAFAPPRLPTPERPRRTQRVGKKLFHAIELIVFEGKELSEAAAEAGLTTYTLRQAFARPNVLAHLRERREVLRAAASGKNILRLCEIRDAENNMPAVNAIKCCDGAARRRNVLIRNYCAVYASAARDVRASDACRAVHSPVSGLKAV